MIRIEGAAVSLAASVTPQALAVMACCFALAGVPEHLVRSLCRVPAQAAAQAAAGPASKLSQQAVEAAQQALVDCGFTEQQV